MKATNHPSDKMTIKNNNGDLLLEIDAEGVEEIKFKNGSRYTGAEIDAAVANAKNMPKWDLAKHYNTPIFSRSRGWFLQSGLRTGAQGASFYQYEEDTNKAYGIFPKFEDDNMYFQDELLFICKREPDSLIQWINTLIPANMQTILADYKMHIITDTKTENDPFPIRKFYTDLYLVFSEQIPMPIPYVSSSTFGLTPVIGGISNKNNVSYGGIVLVPTVNKYVKIRIELNSTRNITSEAINTLTIFAQQIETATA